MRFKLGLLFLFPILIIIGWKYYASTSSSHQQNRFEVDGPVRRESGDGISADKTGLATLNYKVNVLSRKLETLNSAENTNYEASKGEADIMDESEIDPAELEARAAETTRQYYEKFTNAIASESIDEEWALGQEDKVYGIFSSLFDELRIESLQVEALECKSTLCELKISASNVSETEEVLTRFFGQLYDTTDSKQNEIGGSWWMKNKTDDSDKDVTTIFMMRRGFVANYQSLRAY